MNSLIDGMRRSSDTGHNIDKKIGEILMKLIVAGTRTFSDFQLAESEILKIATPEDTILSGCARGADEIGEKIARKYGMKIERYPADWSLYGRMAGPIRNEQMAKNADSCIVFWDGESRGTRSMIELAKKYHLNLFVVKY